MEEQVKELLVRIKKNTDTRQEYCDREGKPCCRIIGALLKEAQQLHNLEIKIDRLEVHFSFLRGQRAGDSFSIHAWDFLYLLEEVFLEKKTSPDNPCTWQTNSHWQDLNRGLIKRKLKLNEVSLPNPYGPGGSATLT